MTKEQKIIAILKIVKTCELSALGNLLGKEYAPTLRKLITDGKIGVDVKWRLYLVK